MNSELENFIKQGVKYVDIGFENCECMVIPIENIIDFNSSDDGIKCVIKLSDKIQYDGFGLASQTPLERINQYDDITSFELRDENMKLIKGIGFPWYQEDIYIFSENNEYQKSKLIGWNKIELTIKRTNKRFNLKDILEMNEKMVIIDENNNTYKVNKKDDKSFINNITLDMLEKTYIIKE